MGPEEESNNVLEEKFSALGFEQLGVGMCSDSLEVTCNLGSQLITNVHELSTSLKHCSSCVEKKRSIDNMYSLRMSDVFSEVLEILGEKGLMEKRNDIDSVVSYYEGRHEQRYTDILKTKCQHVAGI